MAAAALSASSAHDELRGGVAATPRCCMTRPSSEEEFKWFIVRARLGGEAAALSRTRPRRESCIDAALQSACEEPVPQHYRSSVLFVPLLPLPPQ